MQDQQPKRKNVYDEMLNDLAFDVRTIKENHLAHLSDSVESLSVEIKETKSDLNEKFNRLDDRLFQLMMIALGGLAATLLGIFFA